MPGDIWSGPRRCPQHTHNACIMTPAPSVSAEPTCRNQGIGSPRPGRPDVSHSGTWGSSAVCPPLPDPVGLVSASDLHALGFRTYAEELCRELGPDRYINW